jgi:hypothetical protein
MGRRLTQLALVLVLAGLGLSLAFTTEPVNSATQVVQDIQIQKSDPGRQNPRPEEFFTWQQIGVAAVAGAAGGAVAGALVTASIGTPAATVGAATGAGAGAAAGAVASVVNQVVNHFFGGGGTFFTARPFPATALN